MSGQRVAQHRGVDRIAERLAGVGVEYIFGVDGANIEDLYDAAHFHPGLTAILAKHEFSAATMADGYARATGRLGVVMATSGGGSLNLIAGLGESYASRVPVLALVGQPALTVDGQGSFQDTSGHNGSLNAEAIFGAVSTYCRRVCDPAEIDSALSAALAATRRGPAVLLLPKDIQQAAVPDGFNVAPRRQSVGHPADFSELAAALRAAVGSVTILAGEQVARDGARTELDRLRTVLSARVVTVPDAKDVVQGSLGVTGIMGHPGVLEAVRRSALLLVVGTRMPLTARAGLEAELTDERTWSLGELAPFVSCRHLVCDDLRSGLAELTGLVEQGLRHHEVAEPQHISSGELESPDHHGPGLRYRDAMLELDAVLPAGSDIVVDAGNTGAAAIHHLSVRRDGRFVVALGMGGMGYSFGAGIGMAFGRGRRTTVVAGDGAFFMHGMEIHTALQYRLPITFLLFNNNAHAMCVTREQLFYGGSYSYNRFSPSHLGAGLAAMFPELFAVDVGHSGELRAALRTALDLPGPAVICVQCSADEVPPFAPFLSVLSALPAPSKENDPSVSTSA